MKNLGSFGSIELTKNELIEVSGGHEHSANLFYEIGYHIYDYFENICNH